MRYVNRRRLLIVVALAALFAALSPYGIMVLVRRSEYHVGFREELELTIRRGDFDEHRWRGPLSDRVIVQWYHAPTADQWSWIMPHCDYLIPEDAINLQHFISGSVTLRQYGWPFRAAHISLVRDSADPPFALHPTSTALLLGNTGWIWFDQYAPEYFPLGIRWTGAIGNIALSILLFSTLYCCIVYWRARRRIKRGKCWKCGYLSNGAAVCPECGVGVKA